MSEKLVIGPITKGLKTTIEPFYIDNDSFPTLVNAYSCRGKAERKRGSIPLTRLQRYLDPVTNPSGGFQVGPIGTDDGLGNFSGNLITIYGLSAISTFIPGSFFLSDGINTYIDNGLGDLIGTPGGSGKINYASGALTITGGAANGVLIGNALAAAPGFMYYPGLPVMDIEDLILSAQIFPGTLAFDTRYSYNIQVTTPFTAYDVSFYKNPPGQMINGIVYTAKTNPTPLTWNGTTYQQFWSINHESAMWVTNGITQPFTNTISMQFQKPTMATYNNPTQMTFVITDPCPIVVGDWVFANEWTSTTPVNANSLNFQTGFVTSSVDGGVSTTVIVRFPFANIVNDTYSGGILQYLTNRSDATKDCLRWYDGDPTAGTITTLTGGLGWVNFAPPISQGTYSLGDLPPAQYYLVGASIIWPFKDRIIFFGVVVQSSTTGPFYLQDTIIYSQNGTPYYTASFAATKPIDIVSPNTIFYPMLVPGNPAIATSPTQNLATQTAAPNAYFSDVVGFGGFLTAGFATPIVSVGPNQDVLIVGFTTRQTKLAYTGDDLLPFAFYIVNSELGTDSTFSTIILDRGVLSVGSRGIIQTDQISASRIDIDILDQVFQFNLLNNGFQRVTAQRDYINEWCYFSYTSNQFSSIFPNQTLLYNYREESWGILNETFTTYGQWRQQSAKPWTQYNSFPWSAWDDPWISGNSTTLQAQVAAGTQHGFIIIRDTNTGEAPTLFIKSINTGTGVFTVPNHGLNPGDFILITGALGTISTAINNIPFSVIVIDNNTFSLNPPPNTSGTYLGGGLITRMYVPQILSKEFPTAWSLGRKTRIGPQQYLFTTNANAAQITLLILLSTSDVPANQGLIIPSDPDDVYNSSLIYAQVLYTCPESTNLGLTPANINLQQIVPAQFATWHRMNTSLIGDTVQFGFTMSDDQMRDPTFVNQFQEIQFHGAIIDISPSQMLS
jgi:hypothetical protein